MAAIILIDCIRVVGRERPYVVNPVRASYRVVVNHVRPVSWDARTGAYGQLGDSNSIGRQGTNDRQHIMNLQAPHAGQ